MMMMARNVKVSVVVVHGSSFDKVPIDIDNSLGIEFEFINWKTSNTLFTVKVDEENNALIVYTDSRISVHPDAANKVTLRERDG